MQVIITAPSLDPTQNVSGVSSVVSFIIDNNYQYEYHHFVIGKKDNEKGGINRVFAILKAIVEWYKLLSKNPNDLVHYNFPLSGPSILRDPIFMWLAKRKGNRIVVHIHGGIFLTSKNIPFLYRKILQWIFSWNVPFIVLSDLEKDILQTRFHASTVVPLPNCVDLRDAHLFKRQWNNSHALRIGYLGRIEPNKGMEELLEACIRLKKDNVSFILNLAGKEDINDSYIPRFRNALGESFHYSGIVSGQSKIDFLKSLDIFILPSYFEGLPISLLECMSFASVPVVTPVGSIPQIIKDDYNGLFINTQDAESIVGKIKVLNSERSKVIELGKNAQQTIYDDFSPEKYIERLNLVYDSIK